MLLAARRSGRRVRASHVRWRPYLHVRSRRVSLRFGADVFSLILACLPRFSGRWVSDLIQQVPMLKLDPQYRLVFGAGRLGCDERSGPHESPCGGTLTAGSRRVSPFHGRESREAGEAASFARVAFRLSARSVVSRRVVRLRYYTRGDHWVQELARLFRDPRCRLLSRFNRSIWECRRFAARACSRFWRFLSTSTAYFIRWVGAGQ